MKLKIEFIFVLELCGMENIRGDNIIVVFEILDGLFVKKIDEIFYFFNNCVMDVIVSVFGIINFIEII